MNIDLVNYEHMYGNLYFSNTGIHIFEYISCISGKNIPSQGRSQTPPGLLPCCRTPPHILAPDGLAWFPQRSGWLCGASAEGTGKPPLGLGKAAQSVRSPWPAGLAGGLQLELEAAA